MKKIQYLTIVFLFFAIGLTTVYLWGEFSNISPALKINDEKFSSYFTALSSVATVITLFFLYKQLQQVNNARNDDVVPDLYPLNCILYTKDVFLNVGYPTGHALEGEISE